MIQQLQQLHELTCDKTKFGFLYLKCRDCGVSFSVPKFCNKLTCSICSERYEFKVFRRVMPLFDLDVSLKFMTLTFENTKKLSKDIKKDQKKLFRNFTKYNSEVLNVIDKGFYVFEDKWTGKEWNSHVHILYQGRSIDKNDLSNAWYKCSRKTAYIVDIRQIKKINQNLDSIKYVCKYLSKIPVLNAELMSEYVEAQKGSKRFNVIGIKLKKVEKSKVSCPLCEGKLEMVKGYIAEEKASKNAVKFNDKVSIKKIKDRLKEIDNRKKSKPNITDNRLSDYSNVDLLEYDVEYSYEALLEIGFDDSTIEKMLSSGDIIEFKRMRYLRR